MSSSNLRPLHTFTVSWLLTTKVNFFCWNFNIPHPYFQLKQKLNVNMYCSYWNSSATEFTPFWFYKNHRLKVLVIIEKKSCISSISSWFLHLMWSRQTCRKWILCRRWSEGDRSQSCHNHNAQQWSSLTHHAIVKTPVHSLQPREDIVITSYQFYRQEDKPLSWRLTTDDIASISQTLLIA